MTSKNAQCSSRSRFWVLKISGNIGVLKQSQPALFCNSTHNTILFIFTCVMNVRDQSIQAFVTGFGPFCDWSCKFVHWPWNIGSSNVTDMNIHHITECFSLSSVTFIVDRFCLFRTWSFTLLKNDLDSTDNSDSVPSCWVLSWKKLDWDSCVFPEEVTTGCPVPSSIDLSAFQSWEDQALLSSTLSSVLRKSFP